jgi:Mg-chelatase subunit ChlD
MRSVLIAMSLLALANPAWGQTSAAPDLDLPIARPAGAGQGDPAEEDPDDPHDDPPPVLYGEEIESESDSIYYVLDISGSMDWDVSSYVDLDGSRRMGTRIERAKVELVRSIQQLSRNFRFNIVAYDCGNRRWAPLMVEASPANKASATAWVMALRALGATGTGPAMVVALSEKENLAVVLLTDGAPNCGAGSGSWDAVEDHRRMIRSANSQGATIDVFGIAANGEYRAFCQRVAADSGGSYRDVP